MYRALIVGMVAIAAVVLLFGGEARPAEAATTVLVTNNNNAGPGSFRAAVDQANGNSNVGVIKFLVTGPINLQSAIVYTNSQGLTLNGLYKTVVQGSATWPLSATCSTSSGPSTACHTPPCSDSGLFTSTSGGDLTILSMTFQNSSCGSGVRVMVPDVYRTVNITLNSVALKNNEEWGLSIDDDGHDGCGSAGASINLTLLYVSATDNDRDGVRVAEFGNGGLTVSVGFSQFLRNGEDGLYPTEHCYGDLVLNTGASSFNGNRGNGINGEESDDGGATVTLNGLDASNNGSDGVYFEENDDVNGGSAGSASDDQPADAAAEEDGPEPASCYGGSFNFTINGGRASANDDNGIELFEYACGDLNVWLTGFIANSNGDDGIEANEEYGGDLYFRAGSATSASYNGRDDDDGNGFELYEEGWGSVDAQIASGAASFNGSNGESGDGIDIEEHNNGNLLLVVTLSTVLSNLDDGIDLEENGCGNLDATLVSSTVSLNADDGVDAEQDDCGSDFGELTLVFTSVVANADNNLELSGVIQN